FSQGAGFVRLYDYRLASPSDAQPRLRKRVLEGWKAEVYRFCVDLKTTGEILEFLKKSPGEGVSRRRLLETLKAWNRQGLLVTEGARHLSLALPMPADMTAFQTRWQMLEALGSGR
ncbi:MAG TPA: hypothetical protein VH309_03300, partial [Elusimicrobiota bacterium]|nr:hypothetical protein [Elusimicrobiota bacterium]